MSGKAVEIKAFIPPGSTLGVVGGGQLGRMWAQAAHALGYHTMVLDPDSASPAGTIACEHIQAEYADPSALTQLAQGAQAVTTEFENVPANTLQTLAQSRPVSPGAAALAICQDRAAEKAHFQACGVPCAPHCVLSEAADLARVPAQVFPAILKTARLGYDGKGQVVVEHPDALADAWRKLGQTVCVLEKRLPLKFEFSLIVARGQDGTVVALPPQQNLHRSGILAVTQVPAPDLSPELARDARAAAERIATAMQYVGVLCVEFFVLDTGELVANEMAPRPHNSGHYSLDACDTDQFELQVRAMTGAPLVTPRLHSSAVMLNLLGDLWFRASPGDAQSAEAQSTQAREPDWAAILALPGAHLHLYGKAQARPGRKMGHLTFTAETLEQAREHANRAATILGLPTW
jgi:5-(carboxyamino)imidazole ribonucleotide synthase